MMKIQERESVREITFQGIITPSKSEIKPA
jgi:hypothetical protein